MINESLRSLRFHEKKWILVSGNLCLYEGSKLCNDRMKLLLVAESRKSLQKCIGVRLIEPILTKSYDLYNSVGKVQNLLSAGFSHW